MKTFKDYVTMNEAKDNLLTPAEIKKLKNHYDGNSGLRSISQSIKDFEYDHKAFVKLKGNVDKSIKDNMIKTSLRLRKLGIEDGALTEDSDVTDIESLDINESKMYISEHLSPNDVDNILRVVGVKTHVFMEKVEKALTDTLTKLNSGYIDSRSRIYMNSSKLKIKGLMFTDGQINVWVQEGEYEYTSDGETKVTKIKNEKFWISV